MAKKPIVSDRKVIAVQKCILESFIEPVQHYLEDNRISVACKIIIAPVKKGFSDDFYLTVAPVINKPVAVSMECLSATMLDRNSN